MNNYKYSDVKRLIEHGSKIKELFKGIQPSGEVFGYYTPSQANWSYQFVVVMLDGKLYEVVTVFGSVEGGRRLFLYDNQSTERSFTEVLEAHKDNAFKEGIS